MQYLKTNSFDSAYNLAFEEYAFERLDPRESYLMLWQNENTIVVGRHQNTAAEINADYVRTHGVKVVRRLSGGGAVYHDLGNLNFTFIMDQEGAKLDFELFTRPVLRALAQLGVQAELSGRNDLTIAGRKFSGNAQYARRGRVMHHGTLMFDSRLDTLTQALRPSDSKLEGKAVQSVRSRVTNIREHTDSTMEDFRAALLTALFPKGLAAQPLSESALAEIDALRREKYDTWDWTYGQSPPYTQRREARFPFGSVELLLDVRGGYIHTAKFYGDFFGETDITALEQALTGVRPAPEAVADAVRALDVGRFISGMTVEHLLQLLG